MKRLTMWLVFLLIFTTGWVFGRVSGRLSVEPKREMPLIAMPSDREWCPDVTFDGGVTFLPGACIVKEHRQTSQFSYVCYNSILDEKK